MKTRAALLLAATILLGCHNTPPTVLPPSPLPPLFSKAIITREHVERLIVAEARFRAGAVQQAGAGEPWFETRSGPSRVMIVSGHATAQTREGALKVADSGTGSLAVMLNEVAGTPIVYTIALSPSDPNFYDDNDFKKTLATLIERDKPILVLDLHASHSSRPYDVDFGTMEGRSLLGRVDLLRDLAAALRQEGLLNFSQDYFGASKNQTVTKWVSARGVPCIQVEISSTWISPASDPLSAHRSAQLLQGLVRFIRSVDQQ